MEGEADWDMVRAGGREGGGIPRLEEREHVWVGERKVDDARSMACCHGEASIDSGGVKEVEAQVGGPFVVGGRGQVFSGGGHAEGVRSRIMDVEVARDQIREVKRL